jgi:hypothetical protein
VRSSEQVLLQASKYCDGGALGVCHVRGEGQSCGQQTPHGRSEKAQARVSTASEARSGRGRAAIRNLKVGVVDVLNSTASDEC